MAVGRARFMLDLKAIFGRTPKDEALRNRIEQRALDMIRERTADGKDKDGNPFTEYSPAYKASLAFKAAGKGSTVNLSLFGDMLSLMDVVERTQAASWIGWDDELQNAKAWNHTTGDTVPTRDFLGLTQIERRALKEEFLESVIESDEESISPEDRESLSLIDLIRSRPLREDDED